MMRKRLRSEAEGLETHILFQFDLTAAVRHQCFHSHEARRRETKHKDNMLAEASEQLDVTCVHLYLLWLKSSGRILCGSDIRKHADIFYISGKIRSE